MVIIMNLYRKIKISLKYPFSNVKKWLILFVLFVIANLLVLPKYYTFTEIFLKIDVIWSFISIIITIFTLGYCISIIKNSIDYSDEMPSFNIKSDFINGLKHILVSFVYLLIPILVFVVLANVMNVTAYSFDLVTFSFTKTSVINETPNYIETMVESAFPTFNVWITLIVSLVIFLIFELFEIIGICRLAKFNSIKEAFNFKIVFEEFKQKATKLLIGVVILLIISVILSFIFSIFNMGVVIGPYISILGYAYLFIFHYKFIGLLYAS